MEGKYAARNHKRMKESEMLQAWLWEKHRTDVQWRRVRLGVLPTKELASMYATLLRWVDAIYLNEGTVYLVEAKLRADPGAVGQLELYEQLFMVTPEYSLYKEWPIRKILLTATTDLNMIEFCSKKGIAYEVFTFEDYVRYANAVRKPLIF